jgi:hypothetical protein
MKINRFQAFGVHLMISITVGLFSAALVFLVWYSWPLSVATGVGEIFVLLLVVDVVMGPFITLVVFNPKKKKLKRDLAIVGLLQIVALFYGLHAVFVARPVYLVFAIDRFDLVYANELDKEKLKKVSTSEFQSLPLLRPKVIAAKSPEDQKTRNEIIFSAIHGGDDLFQLPQYYEAYSKSKAAVQKHMRPLTDLRSFNKEKAGSVEQLIEKYIQKKEDVAYLPLRGKVADLTVIVKRDSAEVLSVEYLKPWNF